MIKDGFGHGRVVQYAATAEEDVLHIHKIMQTRESSWDAYTLVVEKTSPSGRYYRKSFCSLLSVACYEGSV